ncbi:hypothetical protein [Streptomyces aidingensis]|nr:hypothetical protein [Streptomyces aidingensis]
MAPPPGTARHHLALGVAELLNYGMAVASSRLVPCALGEVLA